VSARHRLAFLPACIACALASLVFWRWQAQPVALPAVPGGRLQCLSYTAFEPGTIGAVTPGWVSDARIAADLDRLAAYTNCLRLYSPLGNTPRVVQAAGERGFAVLLGAWIGRDVEQNGKEIRGALELARRFPGTVRRIVVGNEVLLRREMTAPQLAALIREVRAQSPVPVAYADVAHFIAANPEVAAAADELLIHLLPYWDDPAPPPAEQAAALVLEGYAEFRGKFPGKPVMIGETGWPSAGRMRGPGRPSLLNQARFVRELAALAAAQGVPYNLIEAIDQPWKRPAEGTVGAYWGVLDAQRNAKFPLEGPVSEWPQWPRWWLTSSALAAALLLIAVPGGLGGTGWMIWTATSWLGGLLLTFQWRFTLLGSASPAGWLAGALGAALTFTVLSVLLERLRSGRPLAPAPLAELGRALARPGEVLRSPPLRQAALIALVLLPMAWISATLAFAPRHRDIPVAFFVLPALVLTTGLRRSECARGDRREEATLAAVIAGSAAAQVEFGNPQSLAWLAIGALLVAPWVGALRAELARVGTLVANARQPQQGDERA